MFSSRSSTVPSLNTFKSSIHFELIFVSGVRQGSSFTLWHVNTEFFQHFIEEAVFSQSHYPGLFLSFTHNQLLYLHLCIVFLP